MKAGTVATLHYLTIAFHVCVGITLVVFATLDDLDVKIKGVRTTAIILLAVSLLAITPFIRQRVVKREGARIPWSVVKYSHALTIGFHVLLAASLLVVADLEDHTLDPWTYTLGTVLILVSLSSITPFLKNRYSIEQ